MVSGLLACQISTALGQPCSNDPSIVRLVRHQRLEALVKNLRPQTHSPHQLAFAHKGPQLAYYLSIWGLLSKLGRMICIKVTSPGVKHVCEHGIPRCFLHCLKFLKATLRNSLKESVGPKWPASYKVNLVVSEKTGQRYDCWYVHTSSNKINGSKEQGCSVTTLKYSEK